VPYNTQERGGNTDRGPNVKVRRNSNATIEKWIMRWPTTMRLGARRKRRREAPQSNARKFMLQSYETEVTGVLGGWFGRCRTPYERHNRADRSPDDEASHFTESDPAFARDGRRAHDDGIAIFKERALIALRQR
jgi:hypothetical protein